MNTDTIYQTLLRLPSAPLCVIACLSFFSVKINHGEQKNIHKQSIYVHYNTSILPVTSLAISTAPEQCLGPTLLPGCRRCAQNDCGLETHLLGRGGLPHPSPPDRHKAVCFLMLSPALGGASSLSLGSMSLPSLSHHSQQLCNRTYKKKHVKQEVILVYGI